ncbi:efflux RND transporter permease subunit [Arsukibacterium indicum]|uniref:MMPL family transporter n=1 Tax=Arsukibacterium indicum TaxID=2848612 RepID=A0ABS6MNS2_9GAMM|nr:MMPL family transporter [Arsukibacterium indicum]MBV2129986.1 MMPL family transporter [Arsukibacterium indicum]
MSNQNKQNGLVSWLAHSIVRLRWAIIMVFIGLIALATTFLSQFRIDASADTLLVKNNALYIESQLANQRFSPDEFILVAYQPEDGELFSEQTFADIAALSADYATLERVSSVTSMLTVPLLADASAFTAGADVASLTWQQQRYSPAQMRRLLTDHPIFTDLLLNKAQTAAGIQIVFKADPELTELDRQILSIQQHTLSRELTATEQNELAQLQQAADPLRQRLMKQRQQEIDQIEQFNRQVSERAATYVGGAYVVGQHLVDMIKSDLTSFGLAIALIIAVLLLLIYRSWRGVFFPLLSCNVSVLLTCGLFGLLDIRTTVISANFIALQLILTLAVMIHLLGAYREIAHDKPDYTQQQRVIGMLAQKISPCFYATLTTSVGFGSLIFSGIQPVVDFGFMMLIAMLITMSVSLLLFPALLSMLKARPESADFGWLASALQQAAGMVKRRPYPVILLIVVMFGALATGISRLNVENSFINYFAKDTQVHRELAFIDQQFGGSTPLDIVITLDPTQAKPDLVIAADQLNQLHLAHAAVNAFEASGSVTSLINFTTLARQLNDNKPLTEYELDTIYEMLSSKVTDQLVGAYLADSPSQVRIATRIQDTTADLNREQLMQQLHQDLQTVGLAEQDYKLTNLFVLYQDILSRLFDSQVTTLGLVYLALGIMLLAIFRSVKIALIALIPNILTTLGILGLIGWLNIPLDLMTITIAAIAMGIAVDDTIHFIHNYLQQPAGDALAATFGHTGMAIVFTSVIIAAGFAVFGFSDFLPSVYFGILTAAAMLMALLTDLTILPALLSRFVKNSGQRQRQQTAPVAGGQS